MTTHCTDEDLTLHYYGEDAGAEAAAHLGACADCARRYRELAVVLQAVSVRDVPERADDYGVQVWRSIRGRLPERDRQWLAWLYWKPLAVAAAVSLLLAIGFVAGRTSFGETAGPGVDGESTAVAGADAEAEARRVLLLSAADHLERSDRLLTDVVNAADGFDISEQQQWAEDLLWTSRMYRQDALAAEERVLAAVLDETERVLLEIVHGPSTASEAQLEELRRRVDSAALLFKVRVLRDELLREDRLQTGDAPVRTQRTS